MSEESHLFSAMSETLDPQQRLNMALAFHVDDLADRIRELEDGEVNEELIEMLGQSYEKLREEVTLLRGALEETITQLRVLQKMADHVGPWTVDTDTAKAVRETQAKAGYTPAGRRSKAKAFRGVYCRNCGKELNGKHQTLFCSRKCAARWNAQHPGQKPTPRISLKEEFDATLEAGTGVKKGSVTA